MKALGKYTVNLDEVERTWESEFPVEPVFEWKPVSFRLIAVDECYLTNEGNIYIGLRNGSEWELKFDERLYEMILYSINYQ